VRTVQYVVLNNMNLDSTVLILQLNQLELLAGRAGYAALELLPQLPPLRLVAPIGGPGGAVRRRGAGATRGALAAAREEALAAPGRGGCFLAGLGLGFLLGRVRRGGAQGGGRCAGPFRVVSAGLMGGAKGGAKPSDPTGEAGSGVGAEGGGGKGIRGGGKEEEGKEGKGGGGEGAGSRRVRWGLVLGQACGAWAVSFGVVLLGGGELGMPMCSVQAGQKRGRGGGGKKKKSADRGQEGGVVWFVPLTGRSPCPQGD